MGRWTLLAISSAVAAVAAVACDSPAPPVPPAAPADAGSPDPVAAVEAGSDASFDAPAEEPACPFAADATVEAFLSVTADNARAVWINGQAIDTLSWAWNQPTHYIVKLNRHPARQNVIAIQGYNEASVAGADRGILARLTWPSTLGSATTLRSLLTDASWRIADVSSPGWNDLGFDDATFGVGATAQGANGMLPWGWVSGLGQASWIWVFDSNLAANLKPTTQTVYARRTFYIDAAGDATSIPTSCP